MPPTTMTTDTRKINVTRTAVLRSGETAGKAWVLYEVFATEVDGTPIDAPLRSFDPLGGQVEVSFEERTRPARETTYTLKPTSKRRRPGTNGSSENESLEARVARLERQMRALITGIDIELPGGDN